MIINFPIGEQNVIKTQEKMMKVQTYQTCIDRLLPLIMFWNATTYNSKKK